MDYQDMKNHYIVMTELKEYINEYYCKQHETWIWDAGFMLYCNNRFYPYGYSFNNIQ